MTEDIFCLDNLSALPGEILDELQLTQSEKENLRLVELFKIAGRPLSLSELLVGSYRKFGKKYTKNTMCQKMYRLKQKGKVEIVKRGTYQLTIGR